MIKERDWVTRFNLLYDKSGFILKILQYSKKQNMHREIHIFTLIDGITPVLQLRDFLNRNTKGFKSSTIYAQRVKRR